MGVSLFSAFYLCAIGAMHAGLGLAVYSMAGTLGLIAFTLCYGLRWDDFR